MAFELWSLFALSALGLACVPGPNSLLALSHGARYGYKKTVWTILGGVSGFFILISVAMFGLGAVLQAKPELMIVLQWLGAFYLAWLGLKLWFEDDVNVKSASDAVSVLRRELFKQGYFAALSNPKVLLFFTAFLAQFINPDKPFIPQFLIITVSFLCIEFAVEFGVARLADRVKLMLLANGRIFNQCCGAIFLFLSVMAMVKSFA
ncbi:LysE family translocator [Vibrio brasiliensis]|uniref:Lysine exporter protein (LYSE/YGGA) n=1 Tax=Vibrio brasiliensis LMG 20546 TaxID=945543 RepID=E8LZ92_9VIBR|nr:LysE family translocator [Vibrio brasiliensis]EGA64078.1 Lysine exporter protein (LYSE/YGGA) [Vibrio brasiliensis LMG 20546]